jgi:hypothetical protein
MHGESLLPPSVDSPLGPIIGSGGFILTQRDARTNSFGQLVNANPCWEVATKAAGKHIIRAMGGETLGQKSRPMRAALSRG